MTKLGWLIAVVMGSGLAYADKPHPQMTYGALSGTELRAPECTLHWFQDERGELALKACPKLADLYAGLGRLREDDPQFAAKKQILLKLIDERSRQAQ